MRKKTLKPYTTCQVNGRDEIVRVGMFYHGTVIVL